MSLFSITNTVILKDASTEMHRRFRMEMSRASDEFVALYVPFLKVLLKGLEK